MRSISVILIGYAKANIFSVISIIKQTDGYEKYFGYTKVIIFSVTSVINRKPTDAHPTCRRFHLPVEALKDKAVGPHGVLIKAGFVKNGFLVGWWVCGELFNVWVFGLWRLSVVGIAWIWFL